MKKLLVLPVLALAGTLVGPGSASADPFPDTPRQAARKERRQERRTGTAKYPDVEEWQQAWQELSPADRLTLTRAWINLADAAQNLTPVQKQRIRAAAQNTTDHLRSLTPEERAQLRVELEKAGQAYSALTADQKAALLAQMADSIERLQGATPAQKEALKALYRGLLGL